MKNIDYYELLEISLDATPAQIKEACERALGTFEGDSAAMYSLYTSEEREAIIRHIREAGEVLLDPARRAAYDSSQKRVEEPVFTPEVDLGELKGGWTGPRTYRNSVRFAPQPVSSEKENGVIGEQYRILYTKLEHLGAQGGLKVVAVTSSVKGEGKSATSANLAYVIAKDFKRKVLLMECDMRKPSTLSPQIGREGAGLSDIIAGKAEADEAVCRVEDTSLYLLTCGASIRNSSELVDSPRLKELVERFRAEFDYIIIDTPPILPLMDMNIISKLADGMILVIRAGKTPKKVVLNAVQSISGGRFIGMVLNGADKVLAKYYY